MGVPGVSLENLRKDEMLAHAGIQTPDGPSTSPINTLPILCWFHSNPGQSTH
jgi:hypothetical protein